MDRRIGIFICHCGLNNAGTVDMAEVARFAQVITDFIKTIKGLGPNRLFTDRKRGSRKKCHEARTVPEQGIARLLVERGREN